LEGEDDYPGFYHEAARLVLEYAAFNPHARFCVTLTGAGGESVRLAPSHPGWEKWLPGWPTCSHWYDDPRLGALIAAHVADERDGGESVTVREFVEKFAGLRGTRKRKAVLERAGLSGQWLRDLVVGGDVDEAAVARLLRAMRAESRPVRPDKLGVIGQDHMRRVLTRHYGADPDSVTYRSARGVAGGLPFVLEVGFGIHADGDDDRDRRLVTGVNWSPTLTAPAWDLTQAIQDARADSHDPVTILFHLACPRPDYTDRGKTQLRLHPDVAEAVSRLVRLAARAWTEAKRHEDRQRRVSRRDLEEARRAQRAGVMKLREAAYRVMEQAYRHARGTCASANARQVMYAARPLVLGLTGGKCWKRSSYFTQTLLPDFITANPELTAAWNVVFDGRGHLVEPHTGRRIDLGTLAVRQYVRSWLPSFTEDPPVPEVAAGVPTSGPANRYRFVLFVEKEGFDQLLAEARVRERFDLPIMSTKGMSVTAARELVDELSGLGVTILVLRDFDKSGFSIVHTLRTSGRRYRFRGAPRVIDLGLRLEDVRAMGLVSEPVEYRGAKKDPRERLRECGATEEECAFLVRPRPGGGWVGDRSELNAMSSDQFIGFLERKLVEHGVGKVVPGRETLEAAYSRVCRAAAIQKAIRQAVGVMGEEDLPPVPGDLESAVTGKINGTATPWDVAVAELAFEAMGVNDNA
jgi:hypothetical protein